MTAIATGSRTRSGLRRTDRSRGSHGHKPGERPWGPGRIVAFVILLILAISWLLPFLWAVDTAFKSETDAAAPGQSWIPAGGFTTEAFQTVFSAGHITTWALNSLLTSVLVTVITLVVSALAAYAFSRIEFAGRKWLYALVIAAIIIPSQVILIPLFNEMLALGLVDTYAGIILPQVVAPPMVFILKKFFDQLPIELEEAARVDGAGRFRVFWSIVLPLSRPILASVAIFVFIAAWNNFLWPFLMANDTNIMTLPVGLQTVISAYGVQYAQVMAQAVLAAAPLILVFLIFQRQIIRGVAETGFGGQ